MKIEQVVDEQVKSKLQVDFYVPIKIEFEENDNKKEELFYYRLMNEKSSFVEISVNSATKKIAEIIIVSINDISQINESKLRKFNDVGNIEGNPIINMNTFKEEHIVTDNENFEVLRCSQKIYIIKDFNCIQKKLNVSNVEILLDIRNNIIGFIVSGFSTEQWDELNESIESSIKIF